MASGNDNGHPVNRPPTSDPTRKRNASDQALIELIEHCIKAKTTAEQHDETFLAYMLAMTIQEAQGALDRHRAAERSSA